MNKHVVNESTVILSEVQFSGCCKTKIVRPLKKPTTENMILVQLGLDNPSQFFVAFIKVFFGIPKPKHVLTVTGILSYSPEVYRTDLHFLRGRYTNPNNL